MPARAPAPAAVVVPVPAPAPAEQAPARLRSASYYPEDLAALQSLRGFQPMANEGEKPAEVARRSRCSGKSRRLSIPKAPRRPEAKTTVAPPTASSAAASGATIAAGAHCRSPFKVFGLSLPVDVGAQVNAQVTNMRDVAGRWGAAASTLWR